MAGEYDLEGWARAVRLAWHVPPINAFRALAIGLDGSNAVPIKVASDGTVATSGGGGGGAVSTNYEYREDTPHFDSDKGAFILGVRNDGGTNPLTDTDGDYSPVAVDSSGRVFITAGNAPLSVTVIASVTVVSATTMTTVAASASAVTLLAPNVSRRMATFYNDSTSACYLGAGGAVTSSDFIVKMQAGDYYELPAVNCGDQIQAVWVSATGNMRISEMV